MKGLFSLRSNYSISKGNPKNFCKLYPLYDLHYAPLLLFFCLIHNVGEGNAVFFRPPGMQWPKLVKVHNEADN